jgi:RNAse (barnase) inhibitor barstar
MNMDFATLIATGASGVFRCDRPLPARAMAFAAQHAVHVVPVNLTAARDKNAFLNAAARALAFPEYFGHNWDAFYDCLLELKGERMLLVLREASGFARAEPEEFAAASGALQDAAEYRRDEGRPFLVVIELEAPVLAPDLPQVSLPAA